MKKVWKTLETFFSLYFEGTTVERVKEKEVQKAVK